MLLADYGRRFVRLVLSIIRSLARLYSRDPARMPKVLRRLMEWGQIRTYVSVKLLSEYDLLVDPFDVVGGAIARNGCFEPETVEVMSKILSSGMTFADIGANIGQYSVLGASLVGRTGTVFSFEPNPETCQLLRQNLRMNHLENVTVFEVALSDCRGHAELYKGRYCNIGASSLRKTVNTTNDKIAIQTDTLDSLVAGATRLDVIKLDVEGAEYLVLRGGMDTISHFRPAIILEVNDINFTRNFDHTSLDVLTLLQDFGYEIFRITCAGPVPFHRVDSDPSWFNVLCMVPGRLFD